MAYGYAISDPHGCLDLLKEAFDAIDLAKDSELYLLGDYAPYEIVTMEAGEYAARGCGWKLRLRRHVRA